MSHFEESIVAEVEIKSSAEKYFQLLACRPNEVSLMSDKVLGCDLVAGEFGKQGVMVKWTYMDDGQTTKTAKEIFEVIDYENYSITAKVLDGDLMRLYKNFKLILKATPKGEGSVVSWTLVYLKIKPETQNPEVLLNCLITISKDIDAYFQNN